MQCMSETIFEQETRTDEALDVPWNVVVHNDPINLMSYVAMVFQKVFGFSKERAERHMMEVHQKRALHCVDRSSRTSGRSMCSNSMDTCCSLPSRKANSRGNLPQG